MIKDDTKLKIYPTSIFLTFAFVFITGLNVCKTQNKKNEENNMDTQPATLVCNLTDAERIERVQYLNKTGIPDYKSTEGNLGVDVLTRTE